MRFVRRALQVIGLLAIAGVIALAAAAAYFSPRLFERIDKATPGQMRDILAWSGLDPAQDFTLLHSYQSAFDPDGDYLDYICVQLTRFQPNDAWLPGPEADALLGNVRTEAARRGEAERCFGGPIEGNSAQVFAFILIAQTYLRHVDGAQIAFHHPETNRLLYVGFHD